MTKIPTPDTAIADNYLMANYARFAIAFARGEGMYLYDRDNTKYLDFNAGIAVNALGHGHPHLIKAVVAQAQKLWHVSNLYEIPEQQRLAERLVTTSFADKAFFCNSGAEAIEAMLKLAKRYHFMRKEPQKQQIITVSQAFHGRTFATLAAANNENHLHGYGAVMPGFVQIPFGNSNALRSAINEQTAAVLIEPIQGEGGMRTADKRYLQDIRNAADEFGLLLLLDEVQCGNGRSGRLWAHQWADIAPDIMATAKGLGGGFPIGAMLAKDEIASAFTAGSHGSTFGGNPLAMVAAHAVLDIILGDGFLDSVRQRGEYLQKRAETLIRDYPKIYKSRSGTGLMQGLQCHENIAAKDIVSTALKHRLLLVTAAQNTIRLIPPLIAEDKHIEEAMDILEKISHRLS